MGALDQLLTPPGPEHLKLLSYLIWFMLFFHLPYMGVMLGSVALSVTHRPVRPDLARDFLQLTSGRIGVMTAFGLLPALSLAFLFHMMTGVGTIDIHAYLMRVFGLMALGFCASWIYRRTDNWAAGLVAVLLLAGYCFHFTNLMSLLIFPEKWPLLKSVIPNPLYSITPLFHFGEFLFLTLIVTGASLLFFYFRWTETKLPEDHPRRGVIACYGYGLMLLGGVLVPAVLLPDLFNLPDYALSAGVFVLAGMMVLGATAVVAMAVGFLRTGRQSSPRRTTAALLASLFLFGVSIARMHMLQNNSNLELRAIRMTDAQKIRADAVNKREEIYARAMVIDPLVGEKIFNERCTACHSFDKKVLGPPYNDVLPKYFNKEKELESFILNPRKIDPAYPVMPSQGLTVIQTKSVVKFLMQKMGQGAEEPKIKKTEETSQGGEQ